MIQKNFSEKTFCWIVLQPIAVLGHHCRLGGTPERSWLGGMSPIPGRTVD